MKSEKRRFISYLNGMYKEDGAPELKGLIRELKRRPLDVCTRDDGKKSLVLVHKRLWCKNNIPKDEWPDLFTKWNDGDKRVTLLIWLDNFRRIPEETTDALHEFLYDDKKDNEDMSYIQ